jgi:hypothetical protein
MPSRIDSGVRAWAVHLSGHAWSAGAIQAASLELTSQSKCFLSLGWQAWFFSKICIHQSYDGLMAQMILTNLENTASSCAELHLAFRSSPGEVCHCA